MVNLSPNLPKHVNNKQDGKVCDCVCTCAGVCVEISNDKNNKSYDCVKDSILGDKVEGKKTN